VAARAATAIILVILAGIKPLEEWLQRRSHTHHFTMRAAAGSVTIEAVSQALGYHERRITRYIAARGEDGEEIRITLARVPPALAAELAARLKALPGVREVA
jgi:putative Mg2+ transporter-C (MgtC) family protein